MDNQNFQNDPNQQQDVQPEQNAQSTNDMGDMASQKNLAIIAHVLGIFTGFIGPLIIYLTADGKPWAKQHSLNALNFQLTLLIGYIVSSILTVVCIGFLLLFVVWVLAVVFGIIAAMKANKNEMYKYPATINFIKK